MRRKLMPLFMATMMCSGYVQAQGCPAGIPAGAPGCVPPDVYNSQFKQQPPPPKVMLQKWADRWGTIAYDELNPIIGTATGKKNKRVSEKTALSECRSKGGQKCKVATSYYNQCAALLAVRGGGLVTGNAPSVDLAVKMGIEKCQEQGSNCTVFYTNCSMSESYWVQK